MLVLGGPIVEVDIHYIWLREGVVRTRIRSNQSYDGYRDSIKRIIAESNH